MQYAILLDYVLQCSRLTYPEIINLSQAKPINLSLAKCIQFARLSLKMCELAMYLHVRVIYAVLVQVAAGIDRNIGTGMPCKNVG